MDQEEENKCVSQLQEVFNSCDTTGTGYLDKEELTELCHKLHLDAHLPLLLQTLLGNDVFARVNFDEFKEGFVAVLSSTIDISISEDESSYMEPVIPDEVKPKFVKGSKRYGRRTQPELEAAENETNKYIKEQNHVKSKRKSQLRRSSSLESVESLKSDEEAGIAKESQNDFEGQGQLGVWDSEFLVHSGRHTNRCFEMTEHQVRAIWEQLGVGHNGYLNQLELATVCKNIGLEDLTKEDIEDLFNKLDQDGDGKVSFEEFHLGLCSHAPLPISSTPLRQKRPLTFCQPTEDGSRRTATPSLLSNIGGIHLFSSTDDGTGFGNPEQIVIIWEEEGIEDSKDILMSLDFNLEEQVNLLDLTTALDNELIATKNPIHLAALASYKHELQYQHGQIDQVTKERDKIKQDLEKAEKRNLQLAEEVDDHNSVMEQLNESKIRDLEQEYRQKLTTIRSELEKERDQVLQNTDQEMTKMEADLAKYQTEEAFLRDKLNLSIKENSRLQKEMNEIVGKLSESESQVVQLQATVEHIQKEKGVAYSHGPDLLIQEERFAEIIKEYEVQCRELRDRNDELLIQLETLRSQYSETKYSRLLAKMKDNKLLHHKAKEKINLNNGSAGKKSLSTKLRRSSSAAGVNVTVESESSPMNMETELTKHQLKEQQQEIQDLKIQLETKVNYYEREVALMKSNFEKERRDTEQSFKIEISELEEQKADLEELNAKYQEVIDGMKEQLQKSAHIQDMEKRFEKERAEMEQYYAKEISTLGKRLTSEKDQLEEELKRAHQHELQAMRMELCRLSEDNSLLRKKLEPLQQKVSDLEELNTMTRIQVEELKREKEKLHSDTQELTKQNEQYQDELSQLSTQSLQLNGTLSDLKAQNVDKEETIQQLNIQLQEVEQRHKEAAATIEQMQEALNGLEQERLQRLGAWQSERQHLEQELHMAKAENEKYRDELSQLNGTLSHLSAQNLGKEEAIQRLNSEVRVKTQQQKEVAATTEQLREMLSALEEEKLQRLTAWQNERQNLEQELRVAKAESEKYSAELSQLNTQSLQLNGSLSDLSAQNVGKEETIRSLNAQLKEVARQQQEATATIDQLREALSALEEEKLQRLTAWQSERRQLEQELDISKEKLLAMGALQQDVSSLKQAKQALEEECQRVTKELKESAHKVIEITEVESDLKRALGECQDLRRIQAQLREALDDSQDKVLEANTKLMLAQSQHMREVQQLKEQVSASVPKDQLSQTQNRLLEEQQIVQQMQEKLRFHAEQANRQLAMQQEAHEKLLRKMEDRMENVEMNLKNVRMILQDKVNQLKEQLEKNAKSDLLLKDLYVENAHLMKALQVTEERQKSAEKKNYLLVEKIAALNNAIRKITPASLGV
ncbi:ninein-like protein isoform X2 [Spea bombifrons]|uniref:ninein-like protein isoform X2 n=1 Tax=Spea bombifrons TaxID=233779 RepID=UPI0023496055|nr:ninein-like protein isoform X2 [Spea bombifrons]